MAGQPDVDHLGALVGPVDGPRIIALGTSGVFLEPDLVRTFWNRDGTSLDNGLQAHLYTRPEDVLVLRVPPGQPDAAGRIARALDVNRGIWRRLTGLELASSTSRVLLTTDAPPPPQAQAWPSVEWFPGSILDAAASAARRGWGAVLAFVLSTALLERLGSDAGLVERARVVTFLMDKNNAIPFLVEHGVPCARTVVDALPRMSDARWVFKPAGGAAGVGVFTDGGRGADLATITAHVHDLRRRGLLPRRFQVQEFAPGPVLGAWIHVDGRGGCHVLEIHRQVIDAAGRFAGARWARSDHDLHEEPVRRMGESISAAVGVPLLLGLDLIDGRVIEVNPRLTASAPIAHVLRHAPALDGREVDRIDLDTRVEITPDAIESGRLDDAVDQIRSRFGALVLPQGVDPFGSTRIVVVNDDRAGSARSSFGHLVGR